MNIYKRLLNSTTQSTHEETVYVLCLCWAGGGMTGSLKALDHSHVFARHLWNLSTA